MSKPTTTLGRTERISLPKFDIFDVPAKIDTGADSSAIWASEIMEYDGKLSFVLFDPTSPYYTGEHLTTDEFTIITVKNSFGVVERRYKVLLTIRLGGRLIRSKFNLANRSRHRYPILIGNSTMRNKFLVDVGLHRSTAGYKGKERLLILASSMSESAHNLISGLKDNYGESVEVFLSTYQDLIYEIIDGRVHIYDSKTGYDIAAFNLVYFRTYIKFASLASAAAEYLAARRTLFIDREVANHHAVTKLTQYVRLALNKLPVPDSIFASHRYYRDNYDEIVRRLGGPFILKDVNSERGLNNHLVHNHKELYTILSADPSIMYIAQHFSPNEGDLRVLVFDKDISMVISRQAASGSHLNNVSMGGSSVILPNKTLDGPTASMVIRAAAVMNRQVAGVDIIFDTATKRWYILEVNNSPQISSGSFTEEKIAAFGKFLKKYISK